MTPNTHPNTLALMLDIETLALSPRAHVTQIGYCLADRVTREYLIQPRAFCMTNHQPGREIDVGTVRWWTKQDEKVKASVFDADEGQRMKPADAMEVFRAIIGEHNPEVFGSPAMFDLPILTDLLGNKPWKYNVERDMMTLYKWLDPHGKLQPAPNDMGHDAAADAGWQMEYLFRLTERFKVLQETFNLATA